MADTYYEQGMTSEALLAGVNNEFKQSELLDAGGVPVNLSTFDELGKAALETGNEWTAMVSYEMAAWTKEAKTGADGTNATKNTSTMGGLLETSVTLQEGNMKFQVKKGMIDATAAKAVTASQDIAGAAKGR